MAVLGPARAGNDGVSVPLPDVGVALPATATVPNVDTHIARFSPRQPRAARSGPHRPPPPRERAPREAVSMQASRAIPGGGSPLETKWRSPGMAGLRASPKGRRSHFRIRRATPARSPSHVFQSLGLVVLDCNATKEPPFASQSSIDD
jgi:hypothetical protein